MEPTQWFLAINHCSQPRPLEIMLQPHPPGSNLLPNRDALWPRGRFSGRRWLPLLLAATVGGGLAIPAIAQTDPVVNVAQTTQPTLHLGDQGTGVAELQGMLSLLGYHPSPVDGEFDADTEAAVRAFQADVGLTTDGIVGPATWERLLPTPSTEFTPPAAPVTAAVPEVVETPPTQDLPETPESTGRSPVELPTLRLGTYGPAVARLQTRLQSLGFYQGALDGIFGAQTEAAVKAFQQNAQITMDGIVGPSTWTALLR
jgi:N-acetylmuramoyl-L-alanine amidase